MRRRGHPRQGPPRAHGAHRTGRPGHAHLVLQGRPVPARLPARPRPEGSREDHLLRGVPDHRRQQRGPAPRPPDTRGGAVRREVDAGEAARLRHRHPRQEARDRPGRARGRGRQERRAAQGARGRRARDAPDPRPRPARDRPPRRGDGHLPQARRQAADLRRAAVPRAARPVRRLLRGRHGRRVAPDAGEELRPRGRGRVAARDHPLRQGPEEAACAEAAQGRRVLPEHDELAARHDPRLRAGDPAGPAADGAARRWPVRHLRPERPVPPGHQPEQPVEAADRPRRARDHRQQREADAPGVRRRAVRQRPARPTGHRAGQPSAQVAVRSAQGQAGPVPAEPARQAGRLLRPFGDHRRPAAEAAPVRSAQGHGAGAVQAVRHEAARRPLARAEHQEREADGRAGSSGGVGRPRRGHPRAPRSAEPRTDPAPAGHPGLRAAAGRGQGDPDPPARLHRVQRGLRRRPDGGAPAAVRRGAGRGADPHAVDEQHPQARRRPAGHDADAGHDPGSVPPDRAASRGRRRRSGVLVRGRGDHGPRHAHAAPAGAGPDPAQGRAFGRQRQARPGPRRTAGRRAGRRCSRPRWAAACSTTRCRTTTGSSTTR